MGIQPAKSFYRIEFYGLFHMVVNKPYLFVKIELLNSYYLELQSSIDVLDY